MLQLSRQFFSFLGIFLHLSDHRVRTGVKPNRKATAARQMMLFAPGILMLSLMASAQQSARITAAVDNSVVTTLRGGVHPLARPQFDQGPADPSLGVERMQLVLQRSPAQEHALQQLLASLQDPHAPRYRDWLTPEQFGAQFGVADADIQTVSTWLAAEGFKVTAVNKAHTSVEFSGTVGQVQSAFHTQIHRFNVFGAQHLANVSDLEIPAALSPVVVGVSSLNDFFPKPPHTTPLTAASYKTNQKGEPGLTIGSAAEGYYLFVGPGDAATIYDTPNSLNGNFKGATAYTGSGVTIGVVGNSDLNLTDVANYRSLFGLAASTPTVVVDGNDPGVNPEWVTEGLLDLQVSGGLAPGAQQIFYASADTTLTPFFYLAINRALDDNAVNILSVSVEDCELYMGSGGNQLMYNLWEQAAAQGITAVVSSSDSGPAGCDDFDTEQQAQLGFQVNGISSTPFNISVGGTDFDVLATDFSQYVSTKNSSGYVSVSGYIPEQPWNDSTAVNGALSANAATKDSSGDTNIVAGSGGMSGCVAPSFDASGNFVACEPAYAQSSLTGWAKPPWQTGGSLNIPADGVRDLPDVSLLAGNGFYNAVWLICTDDADSAGNTHNCANNGGAFYFEGEGGTSASAPAFAGMLALISQSQGGARLGQANYVLYNLANQPSLYSSAFHDVTTGNNSVYCTAGSPDCGSNLFETGYDAGAGYDLASGLGSVDVTQLAEDWTKAAFTATATALTINGSTAPVSITHGQSVTLNATVSGAGGTPTGNVAVMSNANAQASTYNADELVTLPLTGGTTGAQAFSNLPGGTYTVGATYGGDISFAGSETSTGIQVTVAKESSVLEVFGENGSGSKLAISGSYPYGTYFSLDAEPVGASQVNSPTPAAATGTVVFADTAGSLPGSSSSSSAGAVSVNSFGVAELPIYYWTTGAHAVSATYGGDNSLNASAAAPVGFSITPAPTATVLTLGSSSVGPSQILAVSYKIVPNPPSAAAAPGGGITITVNGATVENNLPLTASHDPATGGVIGTGGVALNVVDLYPGTNTITANYLGDANYQPSSASGTAVSTGTASLMLSAGTPFPVLAGQAATYPIEITANGFNGPVNLACSVSAVVSGDSIPTCSMNPNPAVIANFSPTFSNLVFSTTAETTSASYTSTVTATDAATGKLTASTSLTFTVVTAGTFTVSATNATVSSPGQSGSSTVTITPSNYTGTIKFNCVQATGPSGANSADGPICSVPAATVTGASPVMVTATFSTTAATSGAVSFPPLWYRAGGGVSLACLVFFGVPGRRRRAAAMISLLAFLTLTAGLACGGGGGSSSSTPPPVSNPGTTTGTYTFTLTGTDSVTSTVTSQTSISLQVN
jgi:hypothetical protein